MEKEKKSLFRTTKNVVKKQSEIEKDKLSKKKRIKKNKPRGYGARKLGAVTFWVLFIFMFLFVFVNLLGGSNNNTNEKVELEESKITGHGAVEYAKSFVFDFFNTMEDKDEKNEKINEYAPADMNLSEAITLDSNDTSIELKRDDIVIQDIVKTDENKARHIFKIKLKAKTLLTDDEQKLLGEAEKQDKDKVIEEMLEKDDTISEINSDGKIRYIELFVVVPLTMNDGNLTVYEYPSFTYLDHSGNEPVEDLLTSLKTVTETELEDNVEAFLETFFQSFSQDSEDKLSYILEDDNYKQGLNNSLNFEKMKDVIIYEGKGSDLVIDVDVEFIQPDTGLQITSNYMLVIAEKDKHYIVKHVNDDKYLHELLFGEVNNDDAEISDTKKETTDDSNEKKEPEKSEEESNETNEKESEDTEDGQENNEVEEVERTKA